MKRNRTEQKERTRGLILETAAKVLAKQGLFSARTQDIAEAAGVAHGTVFVHFPTREALVSAVVEEFGSRVALRMHELAESGGGVGQVLRAHLAGLEEFEALYARLVSEGGSLPETVRTSLLMIQSAVSLHLGEAAKRETAAGKIKRMPLHLLFNTWLGLVHHYVTNKDLFAPEDPSVLGRYDEELVKHFMDLISEKPAGKKTAKGR